MFQGGVLYTNEGWVASVATKNTRNAPDLRQAVLIISIFLTNTSHPSIGLSCQTFNGFATKLSEKSFLFGVACL